MTELGVNYFPEKVEHATVKRKTSGYGKSMIFYYEKIQGRTTYTSRNKRV